MPISSPLHCMRISASWDSLWILSFVISRCNLFKGDSIPGKYAGFSLKNKLLGIMSFCPELRVEFRGMSKGKEKS